MPRFAANLTMMFTELPFLDRFSAAADQGFHWVEYLFPYEFAPEDLARALERNGLTQALFNLPPGDWEAGERGLACLPGREKGEVAMIAVAFGILMAAMWFTYGIYRALKRTAFEAETIAFFLCSICFGITTAYSPKSLLTQTICLLLGIAVFLTLSVLLRDLKATLSLRWPVAVLTCLLLIFNVVLGSRIFGAKNWISIGPLSFQPSELVKIAFVLVGAATLDRLFAKMYEGWAAGRITEYNFNMLSQKYQMEQLELDEKIQKLKAALSESKQSV